MKLKHPPVFTSGKTASQNPDAVHRSKVICDLAVILLMIGLSVLNATHAADAAYTSPLGIYKVKVPGTSDPAKPIRTYLGIQLLPFTRFIGEVASVSGDTLSLYNTSDHTYFSDSERESYLHVMSGSSKGFVANIEEFRTSDIVFSENLTPWIEPFSLVRIRPHSHLSDLLGEENQFGLNAGPDATTADNVVAWDPDAQIERVYYFNSTRTRWEELGIEADASHAVFHFPYGFYIVRRSPGTILIALSGEPITDSILLPARSGSNVFSLPINLSASLDNLVRSEGDFAVISGPNTKRSDILTFEEPTTGLHRGPFYHLSQPNKTGWREVGVNDSSAPLDPLDLLSTLILRREGDFGYVFVEASLDPPATPRPPLPPDPDPLEVPITYEFPFRFLPGLTYNMQTSTDLVNWDASTQVISDPSGRISFLLPLGQGRAFYRVGLALE